MIVAITYSVVGLLACLKALTIHEEENANNPFEDATITHITAPVFVIQ